jgi:acyl-CoA thioesterase-1
LPDEQRSWVALLAGRLAEQGYGGEVVNASISGDTTAGGLSRLPRLLETHDPEIVILELGGNDGLRGLPIATMRSNLEQMIGLSEESGADVLLTGIKMPPNYGAAYTEAFERVYTDLADARGVPLVSFLLENVALERSLMQADGVHPNTEGHAVMFENVWAVLEAMLAPDATD